MGPARDLVQMGAPGQSGRPTSADKDTSGWVHKICWNVPAWLEQTPATEPQCILEDRYCCISCMTRTKEPNASPTGDNTQTPEPFPSLGREGPGQKEETEGNQWEEWARYCHRSPPPGPQTAIPMPAHAKGTTRLPGSPGLQGPAGMR